MLPVFEGAFVGCGVPRYQSKVLAGEVRAVYTDLGQWRLYDDTRDVLRDLLAEEWNHVILSNHAPELPSLVRGLGLSPLIHRIWNIGDSIHADVLGAESVGLRAILVRSDDPRALRRAESLRGVRQFVG